MERYGFIFYRDEGQKDSGWHDTLEALSSGGDAVRKLVSEIAAFAEDFSLTGDVWKQWVTYMLMMHENPFTLACERRSIDTSSVMFRLACADITLIRGIFRSGLDVLCEEAGGDYPALLSDYGRPFGEETASGSGSRISALCSRLDGAADNAEFAEIIAAYYAESGVGMFGLYRAFRIGGEDEGAGIMPVKDVRDVCFDDLVGYESQKKALRKNTEAFIRGLPANNVLLYGDSGTGKSTSIHALMHDYGDSGLRLIEISKTDRARLPHVMSLLKRRNYRSVIFLDDLSFEEDESDYKELKAMLEGALESGSDRVLIYATSNRRHLIRETWRDRNDMEYDQDIHHSDTMEEKLSLASRFGVTIYYGKPDPAGYMEIVKVLAERKGIVMDEDELRDAARKWEIRHGGMSGRVASQFITWLENTGSSRQ